LPSMPRPMILAPRIGMEITILSAKHTRMNSPLSSNAQDFSLTYTEMLTSYQRGGERIAGHIKPREEHFEAVCTQS
jgi:hypothetical protein